MPYVEKRSHYRMKINMPVFIKGTDTSGNAFYDLTHTYNVSAHGAILACRHPVKLDDQLMVSIPAPLDLSSDKGKETDSQVKARVTRIENEAPDTTEKKICVVFDQLLYE